jgi:hypothetical protein
MRLKRNNLKLVTNKVIHKVKIRYDKFKHKKA